MLHVNGSDKQLYINIGYPSVSGDIFFCDIEFFNSKKTYFMHVQHLDYTLYNRNLM